MNDDCQISCLMPYRYDYSWAEMVIFKSVLLGSFQAYLDQWLLSQSRTQVQLDTWELLLSPVGEGHGLWNPAQVPCVRHWSAELPSSSR